MKSRRAISQTNLSNITKSVNVSPPGSKSRELLERMKLETIITVRRVFLRLHLALEPLMKVFFRRLAISLLWIIPSPYHNVIEC